MIPAITIGAYRMVDFIRLNLAQCRTIWPDAPLLVSDDLSESSGQIREAALDYDASYLCSDRRRTHTSGDMQAFINAAVFAAQHNRWVLKLSQRCVIAQKEFAHKLEAENILGVDALLPSSLTRNEIARPKAELYTQFGHLTDMAYFNPQKITADILRQEHDAALEEVKTGAHPSRTFPELIWGRLMKRFTVRKVEWMSRHEPLQRKLFLRKAGSNAVEYADLAKGHGIAGEWDVREWGAVEGKSYACVPLDNRKRS